MAGAQPRQPLLVPPLPLQSQAQRIALGFELEGNRLAAEPETEARPPPALQDEQELELLARRGDEAPLNRPLERGQRLLGQHPLGLPDEALGGGSLGHPGAATPQELLIASPNAEAERPQRQLEADLAALEPDLIATVRDAGLEGKHARKGRAGARRFLDVSQEGHTSCPSRSPDSAICRRIYAHDHS
jgi:hypothetical protein